MRKKESSCGAEAWQDVEQEEEGRGRMAAQGPGVCAGRSVQAMTWREAMHALEYASLRNLPVEVRAIDEERTRWIVVLGSPNARRSTLSDRGAGTD